MKKHLKTIILYLVLIAVVIFTVATIFRGTESEKLVLGDETYPGVERLKKGETLNLWHFKQK